LAERHFEVSRSKIKNLRSKNFKIPEDSQQRCYSNNSEEGLARHLERKVSQRKIRTSKETCAGET